MRVYDAFHARSGWFYGRIDGGLPAVPVGYCADADAAAAKPHRHGAEKEARACYRDWLLDTSLRLNVQVERSHDCARCFHPTNLVAEIDGEMIYLCGEHMTKESVEGLFDLPGQMIEVSSS